MPPGSSSRIRVPLHVVREGARGAERLGDRRELPQRIDGVGDAVAVRPGGPGRELRRQRERAQPPVAVVAIRRCVHVLHTVARVEGAYDRRVRLEGTVGVVAAADQRAAVVGARQVAGGVVVERLDIAIDGQ